MMKKFKKKDLKRDEFKETIENLIIFYEHHKKLIIWGIIGVAVIVVLFYSYINRTRNIRETARNEYNMGMAIYSSGEINQAQQQFEMIKREFWGTKFAHRSTFMLANIYYKTGQIDKALENFELFIKGEYDELFTPSSYQGIAQCYEQKGNIIKALEYYQNALDKFISNPFKTDCLMQIGRIYLNLNRIIEAEAAYKEVLNLTDNPTLRFRAERKLKTIEAIKEISG
jgi:outer membrane protein assembly factor BamD (BamD/ComL family)